MNKKLDKYQKWLNLLKEEVLDLSYSEEVWNTITKIEKRSKHFRGHGGHLQNWIDVNYTYRTVFQIAKICEPKTYKKDDRSFYKFLKELKDKNYISFEKFLRAHNPRPIYEKDRKITGYFNNIPLLELTTTVEDVQKDFKKITHYSWKRKDFSIMLEKDMQILENVFNIVEKFRHKKLAHLTKGNVKNIPTYDDIKQSIIILKKLTKKYYLILFNENISFHFFNLDVKTVFKEAWIKDK